MPGTWTSTPRTSRMLAWPAAFPRGTALGLGVLSALGFEPIALWPLTLLTVGGLLALLARAESRNQALQLGWLFGLGQFALGLNWIATAFTYQAAMPAWLGWAAVFGLSLYLAIYPALAALAGWSLRRSPLALTAGFAGAWIIAEWLRGWVFTGHPGAARLLPWLGTYALSGLAVLLAGLWWQGLARFGADRRALALLVVPLAMQFTPLPHHPAANRGRAVPFQLIQPNIGQDVLNDPPHYEANFQRTAELSAAPVTGKGRLVLWPESGVPWYLADGYPERYYLDTYAADPRLARARIGRIIGSGSLLLTGAVDLEMVRGQAGGARNMVTAIDGAGMIRGGYAKAHLVPYGEYLPLRPLLTPLGLARLVPGDIDFWPGPGPRTLDLDQWGKAGIQICYEIVFSGRVADRAHRPDYIFNPSNDGWFGAWGPPQHLAQARLRALEEGLPVLRATTTGISAVIAADGRVAQSVPPHRAGVLLGTIPPAYPPTLFSRWGNALALVWATLLLVVSMVASRRRKG
ncbi:MAG: apolipoprotein N-acyltransferase [Pseudomonadota bacterium]